MRTVIFGFVTASIVVGLSGVASASISTDPVTGNQFEAVSAPDGITWDAANSDAIAAGGFLAVIPDLETDQFVSSLVTDPGLWSGSGLGPWLGGYAGNPPVNTEVWTWSNGQPFAYTQWQSGQPDNVGGTPQGILLWNGGSGPAATDNWGDYGTSGEAGLNGELPTGYVVEFNPVPEPATLIVWSLLGGVAVTLGWWRRRSAA